MTKRKTINTFEMLRKSKGLSQTETSSLLGIAQGTVSKIENNILIPDLKLLCKMIKSGLLPKSKVWLFIDTYNEA